jgi:hypothetical protein
VSELLFKFLLSEITTVRVHCRNSVCGGVVEVPVEKLASVFAQPDCPICHRAFGTSGVGGQTLPLLGQIVQELQKIKDKVEIEFVLPAPKGK